MLDDLLKDEISSEEFAFLSSLRPSRIREVQAGRRSWTTVQLLDVESGEGGILRDFLERFGIRVLKTEVGQARHLVEALRGDEAAPYVVLACHGDEGKLIVPELAEEYERFQPFHGGRIGRWTHERSSRVLKVGAASGAYRSLTRRTNRTAVQSPSIAHDLLSTRPAPRPICCTRSNERSVSILDAFFG